MSIHHPVAAHELDEPSPYQMRFEDERVLAVAARDALRVLVRRNAEAAVLRRAEQRRETGIGIEARPAQPVDRAVAADQRRGLAVADQAIIFNPVGQAGGTL